MCVPAPCLSDAPRPRVLQEVLLWDLPLGRVLRKFAGHRQHQYVIRSCFGGSFVASGSEDACVYAWDRDSGALLAKLPGHGASSVNAVAWHPVDPHMFASCSDDRTVRIWEAASDDHS
jgi:WD repeat-containing protein 26